MAALNILVAILTLTCTFTWHTASALDYACYPNKTIIVENPNDGLYISGMAEDPVGMCTTAWVDDVTKAQLLVTNCEFDVSVLVSFSDREDAEDEIYGGDAVVTYEITCLEIPFTGIMRTITNGMSPSLSTVSEAAVIPTIQVDSALRTDGPQGEEQVSAAVGDELTWTIDVPSEYVAIPMECFAYPGTDTTGSGKKIITDGCTEDPDLLASFSPDVFISNIPHVIRYYTSMYVFKFYNNDHVFIHCQMRFCPPGSNACDWTCGPGRKRREAGEEGDEELKYGVTSRVLRVYDNGIEVSSSGTPARKVSFWCILGMLLLLLFK